MSVTAYPTLRLKLTVPQALKLQFLPAVPGTNAAASAAAAQASADAAQAAANSMVAPQLPVLGGQLAGFTDTAGHVLREVKVGATMNIDGTGTLNTTAGGGNVMAVGQPTSGQYAKWTSAVQIQGVNPATVLTDIAAAPINAEYIASTANATLTAERVLIDTTTVTWDRATPGQIKANVPAIPISSISPVPFSSVIPRLFTSSGPYTPTAGTSTCIVECIGGGAAGGGSTASSTTTVVIGSGGGSGGYSKKVLTADQLAAAAPITITIGAGGTGAIGANGGPGGDTSFGSLCVAKGGLGGSLPGSQGGAGAATVGAVGDITAGGDPGEGGINSAYSTSGTFMFGGAGGSSFFGGGAPAAPGSGGALNGLDGRNYGSGGSGGFVNQTAASARGGNGSAGIVLVTELK